MNENEKVQEKEYPVVALAGSMKFFDKMLEVSRYLSTMGAIVLMPWKDGRDDIPPFQKARYNAMQEKRIDMCDELMVINVDGYIGKSTNAEIEYAIRQGKPIKYLEDRKPKVVTLIGSGKFRDEFKIIEATLAKKGYLVLLPSIFVVNDIIGEITDKDHKVLDTIHRQKMEMSSNVIVVNKDDYVGHDTQEEIDWARERGVNVFFWYPTEKGDQWNA